MSFLRQLPLVRQVSSLWDPATLHGWAAKERGRSGFRAFVVRQLEIFVFTARSIRGGEISRRAAALTYHTLLAIVPMLAVGFALFKAFGGLRRLEAPLRRLIVENLAVGRAESVGRWLSQFIDNISAGAIAGIGLLLLFYSAISLLTNSEKAFNRIWGIRQSRPLYIRFAIYWCLVTLGPILLGLSISVSAQLQRSAFAAAVLTWLPWGLGRWLLSLASALAVCVLFVLAYVIVPNTRVRFQNALLGGIVAGLLWTATKALFIWLSAGTVKYSAIYGALGALPLLMLWLYYSWLIVLFGVTYTYANQAAASGMLQEGPSITSQSSRELLASQLMVELSRDFRAGDEAPTAPELAERLDAPIGAVRHVLAVLSKHHLVVETGSGPDGGYMPGRDVGSLTLQQVIEVLRQKDGASLPLRSDDPGSAAVSAILEQADAASRQILQKTDLRTLANASD